MIESLRQVQVVGALARLARTGGWADILEGRPLTDELDVADARLLVAAQVLRESAGGRLEPVDLHPWYDDPQILAANLVAELRRALHHGHDEDRLTATDPDQILAMGVASRSVAAILAEGVLPMLPVTRDRLDEGRARFLDVGVGTGAIAQTICETFPGTSAVGLDVSFEALSMAKEHLAESPVGHLIELRQQSVVDLVDEDAYDLAWMPQIFLSRADLEVGLGRVRRALRPGCWLVMPVAASADGCTPLEAAALEHDAVLRGGGPMSVLCAAELLREAGFARVRDMPGVSQSLVMAQAA
ncbi:class I SAM-dependent methyltransferase [Nocardioides anomalus]|uniref:Class I SAM-dependent methyltransferase n=1 Tax=Nocardioides anomalus TaxID=2712223 RepID=A0A6G6WBV9_9ACTN|nr:class I SAM-dependent methyltransferase [Nocardioides anomalus]QIG42831.1 class I SAM-dependent methyltransferase [Nocardioides anomalus]